MFGFFKNSPCQSCGMPLKKDKQGGGTNADGSKSKEFCSHCYQNGSFTRDCTAEQMVEFVSEKMRSMRFPGFMVRYFVKGIPKLKRWC